MSVDPSAKARFALARVQVTEATVGGTLDRIAEIALEAMPSGGIVGMTRLGEDEQPITAIHPSPAPPEIRNPSQRESVKLGLIAQRIVEMRSPTSSQPQGGNS